VSNNVFVDILTVYSKNSYPNCLFEKQLTKECH